MVSVTQRIKQIKQPRGGYLPIKTFTVTTLDDGRVLNYCGQFGWDCCGLSQSFHGWDSVEEAFEISLLGARAMRMEAKAFGPVTADGFTMEGAYTATITTGDGDFLTKDTLWDFKVTTSKPNKDIPCSY